MNVDPSDAPDAGEAPSAGDLRVEALPSEGICATCHQPLVRQGENGACAYCLVSFVAREDDDAPEEEPGAGAAPANRVRRYGHFEISTQADGSPVELGQGAMGVTYRAHDTVLHRAVALKVIGRGVAEHPAARERFLREARAAAQFQHPNVATVSHYGEQDGECFYAMELVEGETLDARLRRDGPLPTGPVLEIAQQATQALVAAEMCGIIHRDLKPTNLMLAAPRARGAQPQATLVKVIDFGLAKAVSGAAAAAGTHETRGAFVGTPAFASPEQFDRAEDRVIDHRADIYSLGVTMWYALCGRTPFAGRTLGEIRASQAESLPVEQLTAHEVPSFVVTLLVSMLAVDPADRPQSASRLLDELQRCQSQLVARPAAARSRRRRRWAISVGLLLLAAVAISCPWWMRRQARIKPRDRSLVVLPFKNLGPAPDDAFYTTGLQDEVTADLAHVAALKVIDAASADNYPPGQRDFGKIGSELGVSHLLEGSVRRNHQQVEVIVRLIDTADPSHPWVSKYDRPLADIFVVQSEIARAIADRLDTRLSNEERAAIDVPPTSDLAAYDLYLRSKEGLSFTVNSVELLKKAGRSLGLLDEAVARDPRFALAYCAIAGIQDELYTQLGNVTPEDPSIDRRAAAESALQAARTLQPDAGEVHLAEAKHLHFVVRDNAQARIEIDLARRTLPNSAELEKTAGHILSLSGHWEEGTHAFERAAVLDPRDPNGFQELEYRYRYMRQYDKADGALAQLTRLTPGEDAFPVQVECALEAIEGRADLAPLRAALTSASPGGGPAEVNVFRFLLAYFDRDADGLARAIAGAPQTHFAVFGFDYPKTWFVGLEARLRGNAPEAKAAFTAAREAVDRSVQADPSNKNARMISLLALIDAALGRNDDAVREGLQACRIVPESLSTTIPPIANCNLAIVYAWTGQRDLAIATLAPWIAKPAGRAVPYAPTYGELKLDPMWDSLRDDERFTSLVQQLAPAGAGVSTRK